VSIVRQGVLEGFGLTPGRVLSAAVNLGVVILGSRHLSGAELGALGLWLGFIQLVCLGLGGWLDQATLRFLPPKREHHLEFMIGHAHITGRALAVVTLVLLGGAVAFVVYGQTSVPVSLAFVILGILTWLQSNSQIILVALGHPTAYSISEFLRALTAALALGGSIAWGHTNLAVWSWGLVLASLVALAWSSRTSHLLSFLGKRAQGKEYSLVALAYGLPMAGWLLGAQALTVLDRFLLGAWVGTTEAGIYYATSQFLPAVAMLVQTPLLYASHARIMDVAGTETASPSVRLVVRQFFLVFLAFSVPLALILTLAAPFVTQHVLGLEALAAIDAVPLLMAANIVWGSSMYAHKPLEAQRRTMWLLGLMGLTLFVKLGSAALLIPKLSYVGAALSTLVSFGVYNIAVLLSVRRLRFADA
jgi:O-antigen/teichoic acid export membrane protein